MPLLLLIALSCHFCNFLKYNTDTSKMGATFFFLPDGPLGIPSVYIVYIRLSGVSSATRESGAIVSRALRDVTRSGG